MSQVRRSGRGGAPLAVARSPRFAPRARGWVSAALLSTLAAPATGAQAGSAPPDIVLIVLDDCGVEKVRAYGEGPPGVMPPCTPNLDALAAQGVLFRNTWTNPVCSPSRAQILTGRHAFRTGIGQGIGAKERYLRADGREELGRGLRVDLEDMLPRVLAGYDSSAVGKWHLMSPLNGNDDQPLDAGFGYYAGSLYNLGEKLTGAPCLKNGRLGYTNWVKTYDSTGAGTLGPVCWREYATTDTANEAVGRARAMKRPWFLYVAFNAVHWPIQAPPRELCPDGARPDEDPADPRDPGVLVNAMMEVLDAEIGRMLAEIRRIDPDVFVFVVGDNGSDLSWLQVEPGECFTPKKGKSTLFENGLRVPLIASGPSVVAGECAALVNSTDLFDTIAELAGVPVHAEDSVSLVPYLFGDHRPRRNTVFAEVFTPNQPSAREGLPFAPQRYMGAIRNERYKLVRIDDAGAISEQFFDLSRDPCENASLCGGTGVCDETELSGDALESYRSLRQELRSMGVY